MFARALETVLPGLRDLRVPVISGALWSLLIWIIVAPHIPPRSQASDFVGQLYDISNGLGVVATFSILGIWFYLLGMLSTTMSDAVASLTRVVLSAPIARLDWYRHAKSARMALIRKIAALEKEREQVADDQRRLGNIQRIIDAEQLKLDAFGRDRKVTRTSDVVEIIGLPPRLNEDRLAERAVQIAYLRSAEAEVDKRGLSTQGIRVGWPEKTHVRMLNEELAEDPLDVLKALDEPSYQTLDRTRAERELRIGASLPLVGIGVVTVVQLSSWGWIVVVLAAATFVRAAAFSASEKGRVLNFILLKGLRTTAILEAEIQARDDVRFKLEDGAI